MSIVSSCLSLLIDLGEDGKSSLVAIPSAGEPAAAATYRRTATQRQDGKKIGLSGVNALEKGWGKAFESHRQTPATVAAVGIEDLKDGRS